MPEGKGLLGTKLALMFVLLLVMAIPLYMIRGQIEDREHTRDSAVSEISQKWGAPQRITGPVLVIPYRFVELVNGKAVHGTYNAYFLPEKLSVNGKLAPEIRYRGIFEAVLYNARVELTGHFSAPDFSALRVPEKDVLWSGAELFLGVSDSHGVCEDVGISWNNVPGSFSPRTRANLSGNAGGMSVPVAMAPGKKASAFRVTLNLNGSQEIFFAPFGKETHVQLGANWPSPSFSGAYLPSKRVVDAGSFSAVWDIFYLARQFPQQWTGDAGMYPSFHSAAFGVKLLMPVNSYQKTLRSTKYGMLCILLTFVVFFMFEIFNVKAVHPVQYLLVALALCVFYLLLLSTSEFIGFGLAYLLASAATVLLIAGYSRSILGSASRAAIMGVFLSGLYAYFYVLLQLEDYALLMGSVGLFAVLGCIMYCTRKIEWYGVAPGVTGRRGGG